MKYNVQVVIAFIMVFLISACANEKDFIYFQNVNNKNGTSQDSLFSQFVPTIHRNDILTITVGSLDPEASKPFNPSSGSVYMVDEDGKVDFPVLGFIKLAGLSKTEAIMLLSEKIKSYVKNPIINLKITNYKVTVLGDVARPGILTVPNERITLLEALSQSGDIQLTGNRKNVLVISEIGGARKETRVDLTTKEVFSSPVYFLNQNDVIYVEIGKTKIKSTSDVVRYSGLVISITGFGLSIFNLLRR